VRKNWIRERKNSRQRKGKAFSPDFAKSGENALPLQLGLSPLRPTPSLSHSPPPTAGERSWLSPGDRAKLQVGQLAKKSTSCSSIPDLPTGIATSEHIIRAEEDYFRIVNYIQQNPKKWEESERGFAATSERVQCTKQISYEPYHALWVSAISH